MVQGYPFDLSQPHEWIHRLGPALNQALGKKKCLPERDPSKLEAVLTKCPSLEFIIDGTECGINRPKNKENQMKSILTMIY